jgi:cell division septal protein FtsQ
MRKRDYSEHHSHTTVTHDFVTSKPKKRRPFFLKPFFWMLIFLLGFMITIVFSPLLAIKKITITGTNDTKIISRVEEVSKNFLARQKIANFFILAKNNLIRELNALDVVEKVKIVPGFPQTLNIEIKPKIPAFIWQEGEKYFLVDNDGVVTTPIVLTQNEWNLPLVSGATTTTFKLQEKLVKKEMVDFIKEFNQQYQQAKINLTLVRYIIPDLAGREVRVSTQDGWEIILLSENTVNKIIENLKFLLTSKFKEQKPQFYLDLRLEDRIFYR